LILSESEEEAESPKFAEPKKKAKESFEDDLLDQLDGGKKEEKSKNVEKSKKEEEKRALEERNKEE